MPFEVIDLMQHAARQQIFAGNLEPFAFHVLRAHGRLFGTRDRLAKTGNAEAALFARLLALFCNDFRIDQNDTFRFCSFFAACDIDYSQPFGDIDLRRGQADPMRSIHGFEHVCHKLMQFRRVELGDGCGRPFENRIVQILDDACEVHQKFLTCSR